MNSKIAIFCSVYNREQYIEETIVSILGQTYKNFEFLIVDDWSCDNSFNIIKKYAKIDNRIKAWKHENKWLVYEYNFLLKNISSESDYITWIDSDDIYTNDNLYKRINILNIDNSLDWIINNLQPINNKWKILNYNNYFTNYFNIFNNIDDILLKMFSSDKDIPISYWTILIKKNILIKEWIINPTKNKKYFIWDFDLIFRLYKNFNMNYLNEKILLYRKHNEQITFMKNKQMLKDLIDVIYFLYKRNIIKKDTLIFILKKFKKIVWY